MVYQSVSLPTRQLFLLVERNLKPEAAKEFLISKSTSKREVGFRQRESTRISVDGDIEKGRNSDTDDSAQILRIFL